MKKLFIFSLFITCAIRGVCQENETTRIYEIRNNIPVTVCDIMGRPFDSSGRVYIPPFRTLFAFVRNLDGGYVLIRILQFGNKTSQPSDSLTYSRSNNSMEAKAYRLNSIFRYNANGRLRYFKMAKSDLDSGCVKYYNTWGHSTTFAIGVITMPLKLRLGNNFDFQGNFSLGTTAGIKMKMSHYSPNYLNILFGASISSVSLDSFSTKGKVPGQPLNIAAFSPSFGAVFEFGRAQAGIFYGWDLIGKSTQSKYGWIYNGKPWISIGFGFSILSINSKSSESNAATTSPVPPGPVERDDTEQ